MEEWLINTGGLWDVMYYFVKYSDLTNLDSRINGFAALLFLWLILTMAE